MYGNMQWSHPSVGEHCARPLTKAPIGNELVIFKIQQAFSLAGFVLQGNCHVFRDGGIDWMVLPAVTKPEEPWHRLFQKRWHDTIHAANTPQAWLKAAACIPLQQSALTLAHGVSSDAETFLRSHYICCISSATLTLRLRAGGWWACSPFLRRCCLGRQVTPGTAVARAAPSAPYPHVTRGQENASGGAKRVVFSASKSPCETIAIHSLLRCDVWPWTVVTTKIHSSGQEKGRQRFAN